MNVRLRKGFTLIELLVVITIIAILAAVLLANLSSAAKRGRDAQRQSDLRNLQVAIEAYKHRKGVYPQGCKAAATWSTEKDCPSTYITGLAPNYIDRLPRDRALGGNEGYSYVTNAEGSVYKIMAMNTVEADNIFYDHPFESCDIRYGDQINTRTLPNSVGGTLPGEIDNYGWCSAPWDVSSNNPGPIPLWCYRGDGIDVNQNNVYGDGRFDKSYALWGGFANNGTGTASAVRATTAIICL